MATGQEQLAAWLEVYGPGTAVKAMAQVGYSVTRQAVDRWRRGGSLPRPAAQRALKVALGIPLASWLAADVVAEVDGK